MRTKEDKKKEPTLGKTMVDSIKMINCLSMEELISLNEMIISRIKEIRREESVEKAQQFKVGDFVCFQDETKKREGIILKINQKTIKVFTTEELSWNVSPRLLKKINKASSRLEKLAHQLFPKIFS